MAADSPGVKPDFFMLFLVLFAVLFLAYQFQIVRLGVKRFMCVVYSVESMLLLDFETSREFMKMAKFDFIRGYPGLRGFRDPHLRKWIWDAYEKEYDRLVNKIRFRFFFLNFLIISLLFLYFWKRSSFCPRMSSSDFDIKKLLREKYGFVLDGGRNVEEIYEKVQEFKNKKNLPINLVARVFPSRSRERLYLYKGSWDYQWVSIDTPELMRMMKEGEILRYLESEEEKSETRHDRSSSESGQ